jgi:hypothetical protein
VTNPSGYITGVNLSSYATIGFVTGISGHLQPQITNLNNQTGSYVTGSVVRPSETGVFITQSQTGQFYAASNPSGFITGVNLSGYVTGAVVRPSETGIFITQSQTGQFYPINNPSGYITGVDLSGYATIPYVNDISGVLQAQITSGSQISVDTIHLYGKNDQGSTIYKGQPVYINGANGANPLIKLASNTGERTSSKTIGLLSQDLSVNAFGYIITEGLLEGFNTSAGAAGDPMWLGTTGNIIYGTGNKPYGNNHLVFLGFVLRSNNNNGKVYVKVQNGFEIEELHKVYAINPSDKDTLLYNFGSGAWFARQLNTGDVSGINDYYLGSNPSGYITGINNIIYTTGNQNISGVKTFGDNVGIGTTSPSAKLHTVSTTEQLRLGYDASNYMSATVNSSGLVTLGAVGSSAGFAFGNTTRPTSSGTGTPAANSLITFADALTQLDSVIGWNLIPFNGSTQNTINFGGSNSLSLGAVNIQLTAGATAVTASAGYVFGSANGQGIFTYKGNESTMSWSKRLKIRLGISMAVFEGDAVGWFWVGCDVTSPPSGNAPPVTLRGYGLRFDQSAGIVRITPVTHDGTNYIYGTPVNHVQTIYTLDMYLGTLNVYNANDTLVATVSGGRSVDSASNRVVQLHCQTTLNNGVGNNYFRLRINQMQYKFLES